MSSPEELSDVQPLYFIDRKFLACLLRKHSVISSFSVKYSEFEVYDIPGNLLGTSKDKKFIFDESCLTAYGLKLREECSTLGYYHEAFELRFQDLSFMEKLGPKEQLVFELTYISS
jgi:hypothetical protein